jgi:hypothetical protein
LPAANAAGRQAMEEAAKGCRRAAVDRSSEPFFFWLRFEQELGLILKILAFGHLHAFNGFTVSVLREAPLIHDSQESVRRIGCVHEVVGCFFLKKVEN